MKRVRANGLNFAYVEQGAGPLVLLLHGFPDTPTSWSRLAEESALSRESRGIRGRSMPTPPGDSLRNREPRDPVPVTAM
jgi:pimeloyl-ACP methyl ester carboxylesterase